MDKGVGCVGKSYGVRHVYGSMIKSSMPAKSRRGFTLIETLLALSLLAVGILTAFSSINTLVSARDRSQDAMVLQQLMSEIAERVQGCRWEVLGTGALPWSLPRHPDGSSALGPMTETAAAARDNLLSQGFLTRVTGMKNVRIFLEYYRGMATRDGNGNIIKQGLMDGEGNTYNGLSDLRAIWNKAAARNAYRLDPTQVPTGQVEQGQPLIVRIELQADGLTVPMVMFAGRKE